MRRKIAKTLMMGIAALSLCSCSEMITRVFDKTMEIPTYVGTVVSEHDADDGTHLYKVTLDKTTLFNYYLPAEGVSTGKMKVEYKKEAKMHWVISGVEVTNHGYTFISWVEEPQTSSFPYSEAI